MYRNYNNPQVDVYVKDKTACIDNVYVKKKTTYVDVNIPQGVGGGDKFYQHNQRVSSDVWEVKHNLNKFPSVSVVDSAENKVQGEVQYLDSNNLIITFSAPFSGKAYLN